MRQSVSTSYELKKQASAKNGIGNHSNMKQLYSLSNMHNPDYEKQTATVENLNEKRLTPVSSVNLISTIQGNQSHIEIFNTTKPKGVRVKTTHLIKENSAKAGMQLKKKFSANPNQCPPRMFPSRSEPRDRLKISKKKKTSDPIVVEVQREQQPDDPHPNFNPITPAQLLSRDELLSEGVLSLAEEVDVDVGAGDVMQNTFASGDQAVAQSRNCGQPRCGQHDHSGVCRKLCINV